MGIFYREKEFHAGKKIRKNDFAPSEKYACYAPGVKQWELDNFSQFPRQWYIFGHFFDTHFEINLKILMKCQIWGYSVRDCRKLVVNISRGPRRGRWEQGKGSMGSELVNVVTRELPSPILGSAPPPARGIRMPFVGMPRENVQVTWHQGGSSTPSKKYLVLCALTGRQAVTSVGISQFSVWNFARNIIVVLCITQSFVIAREWEKPNQTFDNPTWHQQWLEVVLSKLVICLRTCSKLKA